MIPIIFFMDKSFYFHENNVILYLFSYERQSWPDGYSIFVSSQ